MASLGPAEERGTEFARILGQPEIETMIVDSRPFRDYVRVVAERVKLGRSRVAQKGPGAN